MEFITYGDKSLNKEQKSINKYIKAYSQVSGEQAKLDDLNLRLEVAQKMGQSEEKLSEIIALINSQKKKLEALKNKLQSTLGSLENITPEGETARYRIGNVILSDQGNEDLENSIDYVDKQYDHKRNENYDKAVAPLFKKNAEDLTASINQYKSYLDKSD